MRLADTTMPWRVLRVSQQLRQRSSSTLTYTGFDQVKRPRLADNVAQAILNRIVEQHLPPGHRLPSERELGEQFDVSRTVVREAVRYLAARGVVESKPGSGLVVAAVDAAVVSEGLMLFLRTQDADYRDVHAIRELLEVEAARGAARRADPGAVRDLERAHEAMVELALTDDLDRISIADIEFHRALANATGNFIFSVLLDAIAGPLLSPRRRNLASKDGVQEALESHGLILERTRSGDVEGAADAMRQHLSNVIDRWSSGTETSAGS